MNERHFQKGKLRFLAIVTALGIVSFAAPAQAEIFYYRLELSGAQGGDTDGTAHGTLSIDNETGRVIWGFYYSGIAAPTAMHIHRGGGGESGGVILPLNVESKLGEGALTGRVIADLEVLGEILADPASFYVNLHNGEFRGGALRAQLGTEWEMVR
ncbi:MAG: CHRD domain-containing protein [Gammaproteobacteria bacterium]|nr:CHRD domain-containing protein [Gammaproteobacteria bacterium]MDH3507148.1 CHRD domain-containing protein [Gammaproteobacteria bacterium]